MEIKNCKDFSDLVSAVVNYGADINKAKRKFWSSSKFRKKDDISWAYIQYPGAEELIEKISS